MEITEKLHTTSREQWRDWLADNHSTKREICISTTKSPDGLQYLDAVEIFYSFDDEHYTMMRNCWLQDNTPVMVGMMAACPDGNGFKATFEHFKITHLPDQRRLEWLEKNKE